MNAYAYYTSQLLTKLGLEQINFQERLSRRLQNDPTQKIRILSLASGAARIEKQIVSGLDGKRLELTLVDINPQLIAEATANFEGQVAVKSLVQNINKIELEENYYDVIMCVSALHHVVELEYLADSIKNALVDGGEFWSIGEYVGRNGTFLYEDAYKVANRYFVSLPEKYRINRNPGTLKNVDAYLPNNNCSHATFEGIRSEDILPIFSRVFKETEKIAFDCFLWRLFNLAYLDNYDLDKSEDKIVVDRAIDIEVDFYNSGGTPTAYWGVFHNLN